MEMEERYSQREGPRVDTSEDRGTEEYLKELEEYLQHVSQQ